MSSRRASAYKVVGAAVAVIATLAGVFATMLAHGLTVGYGAGTVGPPEFALLLGLPLVLALVAALLWPGRTLLAFGAFAVVLSLALVAAVALAHAGP